MDEERRRTLFCLSAMLRYPDEALRANLHDIRRDKKRRTPLLPSEVTRFMDYAESKNICDLQTVYCQSFGARVNLHLTSKACHDAPRHKNALSYLSQIYREAGYTPLPGEMPDYLPLVLEFMASAPDWVCAYLCEEFSPIVEQLAAQTEHMDEHYAKLVRKVADIMGEHCPRYKKV